ncbi:hypothetical protein LTR53_013940 [Teratosphaeriaceae sp. CCFEE 6253]|nr:hypothetical protein LTR53_013940 [Teratosphaeriaceae sp. CCFEE 6253]
MAFTRQMSSRMMSDFAPTAEDLFMGPADFARSFGGAEASVGMDTQARHRAEAGTEDDWSGEAEVVRRWTS